jgi:hypothetical protein
MNIKDISGKLCLKLPDYLQCLMQKHNNCFNDLKTFTLFNLVIQYGTERFQQQPDAFKTLLNLLMGCIFADA